MRTRPPAQARAASPLLRMLAVNAAIGFLVGQVLLAALLAMNVGGIGSLVLNAAEPVLPTVMLSVMFGVTFSSGYMATAVLLMPAPSDRERR